MAAPDDISRRDATALAAYVDGRLEGRRLRQLEERLRTDPALAAELDRQRGARSAIAAAVAATSAPPALRERVAAAQREAASAGPQRRRLSFLVPSVGLAAAAAAVIAIIFIGAGGPTVDDALALASKPRQSAAHRDLDTPRLLRDEVEGVQFPNYRPKFGWLATGVREDEVDGRTVRTVFYRRGNQRIAYSIFAGDALDEPDGREATREGTEITVFERNAVTWKRQGHTCVLSGNTDVNTLLTLAGWKGQGDVDF